MTHTQCEIKNKLEKMQSKVQHANAPCSCGKKLAAYIHENSHEVLTCIP